MFLLIEKSVANLNLGKQRRRVEILDGARLFVLVRLLQVNTLGGTVQRHLALFAAALRADAPVDRQAEALFLTFFADGAGQRGLLKYYGTRNSSSVIGRRQPQKIRTAKHPSWLLVSNHLRREA